MAEMHKGRSSASDNLGLRALLYASEGMDAGNAAIFEAQLACDQQACEALSEAVEFLQRWDGHVPHRPDASYRRRVRERLLHSGVARWLARARTPRNYALAGAGAAAAAALLIAVSLAWFAPASPKPALQIGSAVQEQAPIEEVHLSQEELELWADLPRSRHLLKVHHEESERKRRSELQMRVVLRSGMGGQTVAKNDPAN